jgi:chromosome segregation ATPase
MEQLKKRIEYLNNTLKGSRTTSPVYKYGKQVGVESLDVTKLNNEKAGWSNWKLESDLSHANSHNSFLERNIANLNKKLEEEIEKGSKNNLQLTQELEELKEKARKGEIDLEDQTRELNKLKDKYNKDIEKSQADLNESNKRMKIVSGVGAGLGVTGLGYGLYKGMQKPDQK